MTPHEAQNLISPLRRPSPVERCPLLLAAGRILRQEIVADQDFPPFDRVMMDGLAVRFADCEGGARTFAVQGTVAAGQAMRPLPFEKNSALEVMTGSVLPEGADCILPCEWYELSKGKANLNSEATPRSDVFIHRKGSDHHAGDILLRGGEKLGPVEISVAAACGCAEVEVTIPLRVAVVGTGDELVPLGSKPKLGQIRQTNIVALTTALQLAGHAGAESKQLSDDPEDLLSGLGKIIPHHEVVILTGGVSKGRRDTVPATVKKLGGQLVLHGVAQRPGKPMAVWKVPDGPVVFGLPGNPVSALTCLVRYVLPALSGWSGRNMPTPQTRSLLGDFQLPEGLTLFLPVIDLGNGAARPAPTANSGDFAGLLGSTGFLELDEKFAIHRSAPYFSWNP